MMIAGTYMGGKEEFGVGSRDYIDAIFLLAEEEVQDVKWMDNLKWHHSHVK